MGGQTRTRTKFFHRDKSSEELTTNTKKPQVHVGNQTGFLQFLTLRQNSAEPLFLIFLFSVPSSVFPPFCGAGHQSRKKFGFSGEDFLPSFRQLQSHQASTDEGGEGQEDWDDLSDADEDGKDEAGEDGCKFTDSIQDAKRRPPVEKVRRW